MQPAPAGSLLAFLAQIPDPRGRQGRRHVFAATLAAVVCAMLQGARGYAAMAQWCHLQPVEVWHALGFTRRPPKKGAVRKLLMAVAPEELERAVSAWVTQCVETLPAQSLEPVAIDGKSLCGTLRAHHRIVHLLSALDHRTGCTLSQCRVEEKTNEAKAALELLKNLVLKGRVVTADAMFCQREICQQIIDSGGHYLVVVKDNQPNLRETIAADFQAAFSPDERTSEAIPTDRCGNLRQGTWPTGSP